MFRWKIINFASQRNVLIDKNNEIMALFDQISEDIKSAMKARDKVRLETLRNIKKVFLEAKTAPGANDTLADADALKIISKLAKQGKETAATYTQAGRQDLADAELAQVEVLESYLPKQLSQEEIEAEVKKIIAEVGATSMKEMGFSFRISMKNIKRGVSACTPRFSLKPNLIQNSENSECHQAVEEAHIGKR